MSESRQQEPAEENENKCITCNKALTYEIQYCSNNCRLADML